MTARALTGALLALVLTSYAHAQDPQFRGPPVYDGAWKTENAWKDPARGDASKGSYAYQYQTWAEARAAQYAEARTLLDCADLSIALICEYAAINKLPVSWRAYYPPERRFVTFTNADKQFKDAESFRIWSQWFLGAMNLADNTDAITYDDWAGGDMVLFDWNQTTESPNFGDEEVWHTYLIGRPDEVIYYGNISDGKALAVRRVTGGSRMDMVRNHGDRYGLSPRRFRMFRGAVWGPSSEEAEVIRVVRFLNLRSGPGTENGRIGRARKGERFRVLRREGIWVQLANSDGETVWAHGRYLRIRQVEVEVSAGIAAALTSSQ
ncbi:MAG: SH3 domain-containing protein [Planctomycetes bacterium]|nr:SH3 domain-containing protein [Planctomycetota bacterium]